MFHADTTFENEEIIGLPEIEERDLSASLTLRWSRKRKRWECRNAFFWQDAKNKWRLPQPGRQILLWLPQPAGPAEKLCGRPSVREVPLLRRQERQGKILVQPEPQAGDLLCHHALHRLFPALLSPRRNEAMSRKKKENAAQSTRQLMGIDGIKDYCIATRMGDLVFFIIKPTNISVLSDSSISARIYALLNVVKGQAEIEMLALNSKESFERNKNFYQERMGSEELPAIRRLLEQDSKHLDRIQVLMASSREFYIIIRLRSEKETDVFPYLSRIEQSINDNGFTTRRASEQDLKRMLGVYFEQNVTTEKFEDYDGDRWVIVGE